MKLEAEVEIAHPVDRVYAAYRDELPSLVSYLPNVKSIAPTSRREVAGRIEIVNHWIGGADLPAVARKLVSEDLLTWDDHATWDEAARVCRWRNDVVAFREALRAEGETRFEPIDAGRTRVTITGDIEVDARKLKMVPRLFAGTVGPAVERFLVTTIRPNLVAVARAVGQLLDERGGSSG